MNIWFGVFIFKEKMMQNFKEQIEKLKTEYEVAINNFTASGCWRLSTVMQEFEGSLREHIQEQTRDEIVQVVAKLRSKQPLDQKEIDYIKLWIVGDAEYYVKLENNVQDWIKEIKRIVGVVVAVDHNEVDFEASSKLRAQLLDGMRVLGDIMFFLKQKERIQNFTESTQEIDDQERDLLIMLLEGKVISSNE